MYGLLVGRFNYNVIINNDNNNKKQWNIYINEYNSERGESLINSL